MTRQSYSRSELRTERSPNHDSGGPGRRKFLAGTAAVVTLALAGCQGLSPIRSEPSFGAQRELTQMDGRERHLVFGDEADPDVSFMLRQDVPLPATPESGPEWIPFSVVVHHRKGLVTDHLSLRLRAPPVDRSVFDANIYLRSPTTGDTPTFTLDRDPTGWTVIEAEDLGKPSAGRSSAPGEANIHLGFILNPLSSHPAEELTVDFEAELSEPSPVGRDSRTATGRMTFPLVRG
ncbi:hypothetical protein SAMN04488067_10673 [Halorubrum xinjiangense]|uniref:DUF8121 domain-containing protein n=1 Tax=Halorubrum xinjiangense TaxID=261291 RepID=A0A1G7MHN7_9EURY|nr:hypothetical protein SAMN04488067_10673 [Halorubrum xinjiangense]